MARLLVEVTPLSVPDADADVTLLRVFEGVAVPTILLDVDTDANTLRVSEGVRVTLLVVETPLRDPDAEAEMTPLRV